MNTHTFRVPVLAGMMLTTVILLPGRSYGQLSISNFQDEATTNAQTGSVEHNLILQPNNINEMRLGIETAPNTFGSFTGTWAGLGYANVLSPITPTTFVPPAANNMFGLLASDNTDRAFFGLRRQLRQGKEFISDRADAIIAWGDNDSKDSPYGPDKLIFSFFNHLNSPDNSNNYQGFDMAAFTPEGEFGIGTIYPTAQLHTTKDVRFAGLVNGPVQDLIGIDANGYLYRTQGGGVTNNCATVNFVPVTASASGTLGCSQIYDNGTSVGIGSTGSFGYTWPGGLTGATMPPASGTLKLDINGVSRALAYFATSDRRFKKDIRPVDNALDIVAQLNPVRYNWTTEQIGNYKFNQMPQLGFIAQDVEKVIPEAVIKDENGYYSMNYIAVIPVLTKAVKEQQKMIDDLKNELAQLKQQSGATGAADRVFQNYPNPHSGRTQIKYEISSSFSKAGIYITDLNGTMLTSKPVDQKGSGEITFDMTGMKPGIYMYSLIIDGQVKDAKRMTLLGDN